MEKAWIAKLMRVSHAGTCGKCNLSDKYILSTFTVKFCNTALLVKPSTMYLTRDDVKFSKYTYIHLSYWERLILMYLFDMINLPANRKKA